RGAAGVSRRHPHLGIKSLSMSGACGVQARYRQPGGRDEDSATDPSSGWTDGHGVDSNAGPSGCVQYSNKGCFHVSSTWGNLLDWLVDRGYAPITAELEKRGFPSMLVHSSVRGSDTPNEDRASAVVKALQNV